ncbi:MAG: tetratricopeptide repeat protein [Thermoplasmata archaeon]
MAEGNKGIANSFYIGSLVRRFQEQAEIDRPFLPMVGGPRLFILLLYGSVLIAASIEFFLGQELWYGSWEVYNSYVFTVSGVFVLIGMFMLFTTRVGSPLDYNIPVPRSVMGVLGFVMLAGSGIALAVWGKEIGGWAIPLSIVLLYGFMLMQLSAKCIGSADGLRLILYGTGIVLMILVPVHEAFGYARSDPGDYPWTFLNLTLLTAGLALALLGLQGLDTREAYIGAWLMGAMGVFLISFHEQLGIVASGNYSPYDRTLALIGITFSFLPLMLYIWREQIYYFLWSRLRSANALIESGDYKGALLHADAALRQCSRAAIDDRFALPWSIKADAHYRMREYDKARVFYETALKIDPKDTVSWTHMGNMYAFEGKQEAALKAFDEAIKADPHNAHAWNNKGVVYQSLGMHEDALICFNKAIEEDPRSFDAHLNKAKLLSKLGHSNEAVPEYQAALEINPKSEVAKAGIEREFFRAQCLDQIEGWEQLGLETSYLRSLLNHNPKDFVKKSKEFLASIVEQRSQLQVLPSSEHIDVNAAMKKILEATEGEGATLEQLLEATNLRKHDIILPLALLMETDHVHFKTVGKKGVYVSKGKAPSEPPPPPHAPPSPVPGPTPAPEEPVEPAEKEPAKKVRMRPRPKRKPEEPPKPRIPLRAKVETPETTASILIFSRRRKPKKR